MDSARGLLARSTGYGFASGDQPAVATSNPSPTGTVGNLGVFVDQFRSGLGEISEGRLSLLMLDTLVLALVGFYWVTHEIQGG